MCRVGLDSVKTADAMSVALKAVRRTSNEHA